MWAEVGGGVMKYFYKAIWIIGGMLATFGLATMDSVSLMSAVSLFAGLSLFAFGAWKEERYETDRIYMR